MTVGLSYVVKLAIACIVVAILMPVALGLIANATTGDEMENTSPTVLIVWGTLLPILIVLGLGLALMPPELKERVGLFAPEITSRIAVYC